MAVLTYADRKSISLRVENVILSKCVVLTLHHHINSDNCWKGWEINKLRGTFPFSGHIKNIQ